MNHLDIIKRKLKLKTTLLETKVKEHDAMEADIAAKQQEVWRLMRCRSERESGLHH